MIAATGTKPVADRASSRVSDISRIRLLWDFFDSGVPGTTPAPSESAQLKAVPRLSASCRTRDVNSSPLCSFEAPSVLFPEG